MYCAACGKSVNPEETFCGACGAPVSIESKAEIAATSSAPIQQELVPKQPMNQKTKKQLTIGGIVVGVLLVVYMIARSFHGPATPEELQQKFSAALKVRDTATLSSFLDADSKELKEASSLAAFNTSLSDDVIAAYLQKLQQEVDQAKAELGKRQTNSSIDHGWLTVKNTPSWLGDNWRVHVAAVGVKTVPIAQDTVDFSISDLKSTDGAIKHLWPSNYSFKATISNTFAKEEVSDKVNFLNELGRIQDLGVYDYSLDMGRYLKTKLQINAFKTVPDLQILLNDKPVTMTGSSLLISPAPLNPSLEVKGTVLGVAISEKGTINPNDSAPIETLVKQGVAKHALSILYDAALTATKAYNDGIPSEIADADPNGDYYKYVSGKITKASDLKDIFQKVIVDPNSVGINQNYINISDSEFYLQKGTVPSIGNWTYRLQQVPGKSEWWIESFNSSYRQLNDPTGKFTK